MDNYVIGTILTLFVILILVVIGNIKIVPQAYSYIIERFGEDVQTAAYDMTSFRAIVNVELSPTFYSWVFTFGGKVQIISPIKAKKEYSEMLKQSINALDEC